MNSEIPYIFPLFWLHGEPLPVLEQEVRAMHQAGLRGFILESRPFPDYMGPSWWETLHFLMDLAEELNMKVMLFDDSHFPSGYADGIIAEKYPEHLRLLLEMKNRTFSHPGGTFRFVPEEFLAEGDRSVRKVWLLKTKDGKTFSADGMVELPSAGGEVDLPPGNWILNVWVITRNGGENHTKNYIHMISKDAVKCYIDVIYRRHTEELKRHIGKSFVGFFSDEPRIANLSTYLAILGKTEMSLPYSEELYLEELPFLSLESDQPERNKNARYRFMNEVSELYSAAFPRQIGAFCKENGLMYIGHVIEDNGSHCRLGYGNGHFFRSMQGQSWAGVDTVLGQNRQGHTAGTLISVFGKYNSEFYHWSLMNLGGSAGTLSRTPAFCEIFGAYGWAEGLTRMKWHTDLAVVSGINRLVPHAFSPKEFPDPDCPPHFYAHGKNPQWKHFHVWADYAQRLCETFSNGRNAANTAVLYHAEAEWRNGECLPNEQILQHLSQAQIGALTVPFDSLEHAEPENGILKLGDARIKCIAAADFDSLPAHMQTKLSELERSGIKLFRVNAENLPGLANRLKQAGADFLPCSGNSPFLRCFHYQKNSIDVWYLVNEGESVIEMELSLPEAEYFTVEPVSGTVKRLVGKKLRLLGNESLILTTEAQKNAVLDRPVDSKEIFSAEECSFRCTCSPWDSPQTEEKRRPDSSFSGTAAYSLEFALEEIPALAEVYLPKQKDDSIVCYLNGEEIGICIAPPYRFDIPAGLLAKKNTLRLELTNTLGPCFRTERFDEDSPAPDAGLHSNVRINAFEITAPTGNCSPE